MVAFFFDTKIVMNLINDSKKKRPLNSQWPPIKQYNPLCGRVMSSIYNKIELQSTFSSYLNKSYAVVPLNGKKPIVESWSELTLEKCHDLSLSSNITGLGLLTGKLNNVIAIDIDSDDKDFLKDFDCYSSIA